MQHHAKQDNTPRFDLTQLYGDDGTPVLSRVDAMIKAYAHIHASFIMELFGAEDILRNDEERRPLSETVSFLEKNVLPKCKELMLDDAYIEATDLIDSIQSGKIDPDHVAQSIFHIRSRAMRDAEKNMFIPVKTVDIKRYNKRHLFGSDVAKKFPGAQRDISEAGTCYALGRWTACMLHILRALEYALKRLAISVRKLQNGTKFAYNPTETMGVTARDLSAHVRQLPRSQYKTQISDALVDFGNIVDGRRNPAMHTGKFYTQEQANTALVCAELFMTKLLSIVKTPRSKK